LNHQRYSPSFPDEVS